MAEGWTVVGIDIERHIYGEHKYPSQLVLMDVRNLNGVWLKDARLIVASPPCQAYSYRAMPWKRAKALPPPDNELFDTCFRIQREACEAAGRHIPLVVENVRGAQKWVGRARWNFGSFYLWGDVPALMPSTLRSDIKAIKNKGVKAVQDGAGGYGGSFGWDGTPLRRGNSKSAGRKFASAMIAKIPLALSRHIGKYFYDRAAG